MFHSPWEIMLISNRKWVLRSRVLRNRKWHYTGSASQISRAAARLGTPQIDRSLKFVSLTALVHFCSGAQTDHSTALTLTTATRCRHRNLAVSKSIVCKTYRAEYRFEMMLWCSHLYIMILLPTLRGTELHDWAKNKALYLYDNVGSLNVESKEQFLKYGMHCTWENLSDIIATEFWQRARKI